MKKIRPLSAPERRRLWQRLGIPASYPRTRGLPVQREARALVSIGRAADDGKLLRLTPAAAAAWRRLLAAATRDGVQLRPISAYRSVARQTKLIRRKLAAGQTIDEVLRYVAAPGCSEHHTGRAIDLGSPEEHSLDEEFALTAEFKWLKRNAGKFGFHLSYPRKNRHGIGYEPWHWCWRARAKKSY